MEYNEENMEKVAYKVAMSWDHKVILQFAVKKLVETYAESELLFREDCKNIGT